MLLATIVSIMSYMLTPRSFALGNASAASASAWTLPTPRTFVFRSAEDEHHNHVYRDVDSAFAMDGTHMHVGASAASGRALVVADPEVLQAYNMTCIVATALACGYGLLIAYILVRSVVRVMCTGVACIRAMLTNTAPTEPASGSRDVGGACSVDGRASVASSMDDGVCSPMCGGALSAVKRLTTHYLIPVNLTTSAAPVPPPTPLSSQYRHEGVVAHGFESGWCIAGGGGGSSGGGGSRDCQHLQLGNMADTAAEAASTATALEASSLFAGVPLPRRVLNVSTCPTLNDTRKLLINTAEELFRECSQPQAVSSEVPVDVAMVDTLLATCHAERGAAADSWAGLLFSTLLADVVRGAVQAGARSAAQETVYEAVCRAICSGMYENLLHYVAEAGDARLATIQCSDMLRRGSTDLIMVVRKHGQSVFDMYDDMCVWVAALGACNARGLTPIALAVEQLNAALDAQMAVTDSAAVSARANARVHNALFVAATLVEATDYCVGTLRAVANTAMCMPNDEGMGQVAWHLSVLLPSLVHNGELLAAIDVCESMASDHACQAKIRALRAACVGSQSANRVRQLMLW